MLLRTGRLLLLLVATGWRLVPAQSLPDGNAGVSKDSGESGSASRRESGGEVLRGILTDSAGPYSIFLGAAIAGVHQATDNPPDWRQGFPALSKRFGSNMGITGVGNSVRYGLGWAANDDFHFHKCSCKGVVPRIGHAFKSTAVARSRADGSAVISFPNLIAPYVATTSAVYAWYPDRYGIKDAFRMGNYNLLGTVASNLVFEFMPGKALRFLRRFHLSGSH